MMSTRRGKGAKIGKQGPSESQTGLEAKTKTAPDNSVESSIPDQDISVVTSTPIPSRPQATTSKAVASAFTPVNLFTNTTMNKTVKDVAVGASNPSRRDSHQESHRSTTSSYRRQKQLQLEIAAEKRKMELDEEEAKLKLGMLAAKRAREETINKKLQELAACDESVNDVSLEEEKVEKSKQDVMSWMNRHEQISLNNVHLQPRTNAMKNVPEKQSCENPDYFKNFLARQTVGCKLPSFTGNPQEWPMFISQYENTTKLCGLGNHENMVRLQEALKGKARETVESIMGFPENVDMVIETLRLSFGRDDQIIKSLMTKAKMAVPPKEGRPESIITFYNAVNNMVMTLQRMGSTDHLKNPCLLEEFIQKMSPQLRSHWALYLLDHSGENNLQTFVVWLKRWASAQSLLPASEAAPNDKNTKKPTATVLNATEEGGNEADNEEKTVKKSQDFTCTYCKKPRHSINRCRKFKSATVEERWNFVKSQKCCFICLRQGHNTTTCRSNTKCTIPGCEKKHHTLLHNEASVVPKPEAVVLNAVATNQALLKILPVTLKSENGEVQTYALLDEGSTVTLLEEEVADQLKLGGAEIDFAFRGINAISTRAKSKVVKFLLSPSGSDDCFQLQNVKTVANLRLPTQTVRRCKRSDWSHLQDLNITMYQNASPKLLIGQDHIDLIITREVREGPPNAPVASRTKLGWVLHGNAYSNLNNTDVILNCYEIGGDENRENDRLHELVKSYFKLEALEVSNRFENARSREDKLALQMMDERSRRDGDSWTTGLLWRNNDVHLPESRSHAERRLRHIERKMDKDPIFSKTYCKKIDDHIAKGYIRELTETEAEVETSKTWYLPHFAVVNPNKPNKIRVVWDAAAKSGGTSLNNQLLTGPDFYNSLPGVICTFRQRCYAFGADIEEMFLRIKILEEDWQAQRFLWRGEIRSQKPKVYALVRVLFGSVCSPSQAQYIKNRNARELIEEFTRAVDAIINRHYMDDYLDSVDTFEEAKALVRDVIHVHSTGGFKIRNWISNDPTIFEDIEPELVADGMKSIKAETEHPVERVLGLRWNPNNDTFNFDVKFHKVSDEVLRIERRPTKREILTVIMSIFDPLGFISHFHVKGKILLQSVWKSGIGWDDELGNELFKIWSRWLEEMRTLPSLEIPRWYGFPPNTKLQLHVFCDASSAAYAAVSYLRGQQEEAVYITLVMSKTRVAPLKPVTIPRLELLAALLGSKMADFVRHHHDIKIESTYLWTDSQTVLRWIRSDSNRYKTFVAQRLGEIDELTDVSQWKWVPTKENVADDATRGDTEADLTPSSRWFKGPAFLYLEETLWPKEAVSKAAINTDGASEVLEFVHAVTPYIPCLPDPSRFSSFTRLLRATAWVMRFISRCRDKSVHGKGLQPEEIVAAELLWWRCVQWECFPKEMAALTQGGQVAASSSLRAFAPCVDQAGVMRLTSRAKHCPGVGEQVILSRNHRFAFLLVDYYHRKHLHVGQETVVNEMRQIYWIPALRQLVKAVRFQCNVCKKLNASTNQPVMGLLPEERLTPYVKPFHFTGIDYFGPLQVRIGKKYEKRYGVIFSCLVTRAIHLEVAEKLNADSAIMAVKRVIALRGKIDMIWSDNGKNLVGANNELKLLLVNLEQSNIEDKMASDKMTQGIRWKFIPPASPNFGGAWERLIRSVKTAMRAVLSKQVLRQEALQTLLAEISHTLNSRPLTHVSVDPKDPESITPNHLLWGMSTDVVQQLDPKKVNLRRQWITAQRHADNFWRRWIKEYRPSIVQKTKWYKTGRNMQPDDIVIIVDESLPRNFWPMGRVTEVYPGRDEVVRVVDVKTTTGTYRRPVSKLCLLDVKEE